MNNFWNKFVEDINDFGYNYVIPDDIDYFYGKIPFYGYTNEWEDLSIEDVKKIGEKLEKKEKFILFEDWLALLVKMKDGHWYTLRHDENYDTFWWTNFDNDD